MGTWSGWGSWRSSIGSDERESWSGDEKSEVEGCDVQLVGKGSKNGGQGFQGRCFACGEFGHTQWERRKANGRKPTKDTYGKDQSNAKGQGKDYAYSKGQSGAVARKWYGGDAKGYGKGDYDWRGGGGGKGPKMQKARFGCGSTEHLMWICPKGRARVQNAEEEPEVLFIGRIDDSNKGEDERLGAAWRTRAPCKIPMGRYSGQPMKVQTSHKKSMLRNSFEVLEAEQEGEDEEVFVGSVGCMADREEEHKGKPKVKQTRSVSWTKDGKADDWFSLGAGDIIIDSAADKSCWPEGQGDAFPTKPTNKRLRLTTASGGDMEHDGKKEVFFKNGGGGDLFGWLVQVTDVRKPLLSVRRLVDQGNKVCLAPEGAESYAYDPTKGANIPVVKKVGSFVIEAHCVKKPEKPAFARQACARVPGGKGAPACRKTSVGKDDEQWARRA